MQLDFYYPHRIQNLSQTCNAVRYDIKSKSIARSILRHYGINQSIDTPEVRDTQVALVALLSEACRD